LHVASSSNTLKLFFGAPKIDRRNFLARRARFVKKLYSQFTIEVEALSLSSFPLTEQIIPQIKSALMAAAQKIQDASN
jgi:hypothetical protein